MSKLLKEAIADAKAVRETALANARLALEEAFAPRLQSMLTKKLREEEAELDGVEDEVEVSDEVEEGSYSEDDVEIEEPSAEDEVEEGAYLEDDEESEDEVADVDAEEAPAEDEVADEAPEVEDEVEDEEEIEEDSFDLDSIIAELESELTTEEEEEGEEESEEEDAESVEEQSDSSELGIKGEEHVNIADSDDEDLPDGTEVQSSEVGNEDDETPKVADIDEEIDIEIVDEEVAAGDESDEPTATESDEELAFPTNEAEDCNQGGDIGEDDEEINLEEILKELEDESSLEDEEADSEIEEIKATNNKLQKENDEYRKVYKYLRGKLNEVNLLNAKLLYTNKLFKAHVLSEDQKLKVVESFDLTKNVREAKLVYATLGESFRSSDTPVKTKVTEAAPTAPKAPKTTKKSLTEGMASKAIKSTKPSKQILTEGDQLANRFKKLAGIV
jgi:hypothetical protein